VAVILCPFHNLDCELDDRNDANDLDAMTPDWPYSRAVPYEAARREIERCAGIYFDPAVVRTFLTIPATVFEEIRRWSLEP